MRRSTLFTIVVFIVLAGAVFFVSREPANRGVERLDFTSVDSGTIDHITLTKADKDLVALTRENGTWRLGNGHLADEKTIDRALDALAKLNTSDVVSTSADRQKTYGVDADNGVTIDVAAGGDDVARLIVGHNDKGGEFVRAADSDTIFKAPETLSWTFPEDPNRWLKLTLVDAKLGDVTRIDIDRADGESFSIAPKADSDDWTITDESLLPKDFRFDGPGAHKLANTAVSIRASKVIDDEPDDSITGLGGDHDRFTIVTAAGSTTLHLGNSAADGGVYARVDGRDGLFVVPDYEAQALRKSVRDLRDLRPMAIEPANVTGVLVKSGDDEIQLVRGDDGSWSIDGTVTPPPDGYEFDPDAVSRFLGEVASMTATAIADDISPRRAGLEHPDPSVDLTLADGTTARLAFGHDLRGEKDKKVYVHGNADDHIYVMPAFRRDRIKAGWNLFKVQPPPENPYANLDPQTLSKLPPEVRQQILEKMKQQQAQQQMMQQLKKRADK